MTYQDLLTALRELTFEELEYDVICYDDINNKYRRVIATDKTVVFDILDDGHPVLIVEQIMDYPGTRKLTYGYVVQFYSNDGKCLGQEFIAGDLVEWKAYNDKPISSPKHEYMPFDMCQPS